MMKIALVTYQDKGAYHAIDVSNEDEQLIDFLRSKDLDIKKEIWNNPDVEWEAYDLAIVKSPWDYFDLIHDFYTWLNDMDQREVKLLNPSSVLKWNADKHYLKDIQEAGLLVTPTVYLSKRNKVDVSIYFSEFNVGKLIVKPAVSGGAKNTFKVTPNNASDISDKLNVLLQEEDFIVQPFLEEVAIEGELSFLFFGGVFSHAVLKKAANGDFRVQSTFGGTVHPITPTSKMISAATAYVDQFAKNCLYARVDAVIVKEQFMLMELELIEPYLFLDTSQNSLDRYYQSLMPLLPSN
jgi:glutathione synthase/RimK-type ligase-like ATP-grasp enzyme